MCQQRTSRVASFYILSARGKSQLHVEAETPTDRSRWQTSSMRRLQVSRCNITQRLTFGSDQRPTILAFDDRHRCLGCQAAHNRRASAWLDLKLRNLSHLIFRFGLGNRDALVLQYPGLHRQREVGPNFYFWNLPLFEHLFTEFNHSCIDICRKFVQIDGSAFVAVGLIDGVKHLVRKKTVAAITFQRLLTAAGSCKNGAAVRLR
jgi:hypothetical protein